MSSKLIVTRDLLELWDQFKLFGETNCIGAAAEQEPVHKYALRWALAPVWLCAALTVLPTIFGERFVERKIYRDCWALKVHQSGRVWNQQRGTAARPRKNAQYSQAD